MIPNSKCVHVIDVQNAFFHPEGLIQRSGIPMWQPEIVLEENRKLVDFAHEYDIPIIFSRYTWRRNGLNSDLALSSSLGSTAFLEDSWDVAIHDSIDVFNNDSMIDKPRFDNFLYTDLELVLSRLGCTEILLSGASTNACVESTARGATQRGFQVFVAEDATTAATGQHELGLSSIGAAFGTIIKWREFF